MNYNEDDKEFIEFLRRDDERSSLRWEYLAKEAANRLEKRIKRTEKENVA